MGHFRFGVGCCCGCKLNCTCFDGNVFTHKTEEFYQVLHWDLTQFQGDGVAYPGGFWRIYAGDTHHFGSVDENGKMVGLPDSFSHQYSGYRTASLVSMCECEEFRLATNPIREGRWDLTQFQGDGVAYPGGFWRIYANLTSNATGIFHSGTINERGQLVGLPSYVDTSNWYYLDVTCKCETYWITKSGVPANDLTAYQGNGVAYPVGFWKITRSASDNAAATLRGPISESGKLLGLPSAMQNITGTVYIGTECEAVCDDIFVAEKELAIGESWDLTPYKETDEPEPQPRDYVAYSSKVWRIRIFARTTDGSNGVIISAGIIDENGRLVGLPDSITNVGLKDRFPNTLVQTLTFILEGTCEQEDFVVASLYYSQTYDMTKYQDFIAYPNSFWAIGNENVAYSTGVTDENGRMAGLPDFFPNDGTYYSNIQLSVSSKCSVPSVIEDHYDGRPTGGWGDPIPVPYVDLTNIKNLNFAPGTFWWFAYREGTGNVGKLFCSGIVDESGKITELPDFILSDGRIIVYSYSLDFACGCETFDFSIRGIFGSDPLDLTPYQGDGIVPPNRQWRLVDDWEGPIAARPAARSIVGEVNENGKMVGLPDSFLPSHYGRVGNLYIDCKDDCVSYNIIARDTVYDPDWEEMLDLTQFQGNGVAHPGGFWRIDRGSVNFNPYIGSCIDGIIDENGQLVGLPDTVEYLERNGFTPLALRRYCEDPVPYVAVNWKGIVDDSGDWMDVSDSKRIIAQNKDRYWRMDICDYGRVYDEVIVGYAGYINENGLLTGFPNKTPVSYPGGASNEGNYSITIMKECESYTVKNESLTSDSLTFDLTDYQDYTTYPNRFWMFNSDYTASLWKPLNNGISACTNDCRKFSGITDEKGRLTGLPESITFERAGSVYIEITCECKRHRIVVNFNSSPLDLTPYQGDGVAYPNQLWRLCRISESTGAASDTKCSGVIDENGKLIGLPSSLEYGYSIMIECACGPNDNPTEPINLSSLTDEEREEFGL